MALSRTQLDKLGERLKAGTYDADDLRRLDEYRRSFSGASEAVTRILRDECGLSPTARPAKSTKAIVEKLTRLSTQLTRIQDIAGCRVVVDNLLSQQIEVKRLREYFPEARVIDRVVVPSSGYRAIHVVVKHEGHWVEVQFRTELQHLWAVLSEKVADRFGNALKYGGGDGTVQTRLNQLANTAYHVDFLQVIFLTVPEAGAEGDEGAGSGREADFAELDRFRRLLSDKLHQYSEHPDSLLDDT